MEVDTVDKLVGIFVGLSALSWSVAKIYNCLHHRAIHRAIRETEQAVQIKSIDKKTDQIHASVKTLADNHSELKNIQGQHAVMIEQTQELINHHIEWCEKMKSSQ